MSWHAMPRDDRAGMIDPLDRFCAMAHAAPERPAVVVAGVVTSYGALLAKAAAFATVFMTRPEPHVLIACPGGADAYAAMLGAGLAGGYYTPVNVDAARDKLAAIARTTQPQFIVADDDLAPLLLTAAPRAQRVAPASIGVAANPLPVRSRHGLAYVIFTSGSTGTPKGVCISRTALTHFVDWIERSLAPRPTDRWAQFGNIGFDISVTDIYGALCFGASLHPPATRRDRLFPARMIARERLTIWNSVPSLVALMIKARELTYETIGTLRLMNFCGEPLLADQLRSIFGAHPAVVVQNTYGPTEATVSMTSLPMRAGDYARYCRETVALGSPIAGMGLHLVGGPSDDEGELVITGPQLADGYWRDEAKSAAAFRIIDIAGVPTRGYFTGDWAQRRNGALFFKTRTDFQVKIRGFRVELDEVAAAIRRCGWPVVVVVKHGEALAAIIETADPSFDPGPLRTTLAQMLDPHAIPVVILPLPLLPRNENDKIDQRAAAGWLERTVSNQFMSFEQRA